MPGPIKQIKSGIQGVKNGVKAVKVNNRIAKHPELNPQRPSVKKSVTPSSLVKSFVNGVKDPKNTSLEKGRLKMINTVHKKKLSEKA